MTAMTEQMAHGHAKDFHPSELSTFHKNPRVGNVDAIAASLRANSQYKPIVVNTGTYTGRPNEVLAGNHTLKAFRNLAEKHPEDERWQTIATWVIDVDDDRASRIVLADNRTSELGSMDDTVLSDLLGTLEDLDGTGYDDGDFQDIIDGIGMGESGDGQVEESEPGEKVELWGITVGEPDITPEAGSIWRMGIHTLCVVDLNRDHAQYIPYLTDDSMLYPYPSLLAPFTDKVRVTPCVFVQPNTYMAGWLLTKWNRIMPDEQAERIVVGGDEQ